MKFVKRSTYPSKDNKYYFDASVNPWTRKGLGTCTRYAQGRIMECTRDKTRKYKDTWYPVDMLNRCSEVGAKKVSKPTLGGFGVWKNSKLPTGHIAFIEALESNGDIWVSQVSSKEEFSYVKLTKKSGYKNGEYSLVGFADLQVKWDSATEPTKADDPIPNRYKVVKDGKQIEADTYYDNALNTANKNGADIIDSTTGKVIYSAKKELTDKSYPDYPINSGKYYYVMEAKQKWNTSQGAFSFWSNAYSAWVKVKSKGFHIFDKDWNILD